MGIRRLGLFLSLSLTLGLAAALTPSTVTAAGDARYSVPKDKLDAALPATEAKRTSTAAGASNPSCSCTERE